MTVTSEMAAAGVRALTSRYLELTWPELEAYPDIVREVFEAMTAARRPKMLLYRVLQEAKWSPEKGCATHLRHAVRAFANERDCVTVWESDWFDVAEWQSRGPNYEASLKKAEALASELNG